MRKLSIIFLITGLSLLASAQTTTYTAPRMPIDSNTKKITYVEVITQTGTKDTLFNRAIEWCNKFFKNAQSATTTRNKDDGKIAGTYRFKVFNPPDKDGLKTDAGVISYSFMIESKENKYRYKITDLNLKGLSYYPLERWLDVKEQSYSPLWNYYLIQVDDYMKEFGKSLKAGMKAAKKVSDDW